MKTILLAITLFLFQDNYKQYQILKRCWNNDCEKFEAVVSITSHEVYFHKKGTPNATLRIVQSFDFKGKEHHLLQGDTLINDSLFIFYRGVVIVDEQSKVINVEVRTPKSYHFVKYLYK